jgi:hypothetical protein
MTNETLKDLRGSLSNDDIIRILASIPDNKQMERLAFYVGKLEGHIRSEGEDE